MKCEINMYDGKRTKKVDSCQQRVTLALIEMNEYSSYCPKRECRDWKSTYGRYMEMNGTATRGTRSIRRARKPWAWVSAKGVVGFRKVLHCIECRIGRPWPSTSSLSRPFHVRMKQNGRQRSFVPRKESKVCGRSVWGNESRHSEN